MPFQKGTNGKRSYWPHSRREQLEKEGRDTTAGIDLDGPGGYLLRALVDAGCTMFDGAGNERPLKWLDVWSFAQCTGQVDEPWECRLLIELSMAYLRGKIEGADPLGIAPIERGGADG